MLGDSQFDSRFVRIGELARLARVSPRTIDYYTKLGLLAPAVRTNGSHRLYNPECVERVQQIRVLQAQRLSLWEIRERLNTAANGQFREQALSALEEAASSLERLQQELVRLAGRTKDLSETPGRDELVRNVNAMIAKSASVLQALVFLANNLTLGG